MKTGPQRDCDVLKCASGCGDGGKGLLPLGLLGVVVRPPPGCFTNVPHSRITISLSAPPDAEMAVNGSCCLGCWV
ncbi:hypothetical protein NDU88_001681 [Pleurodeles waltl]|uniref:Uncharacterized protein n=1 Tax=Pleurodeles waltl TaxID=8319 RepID=A0AAV7KU11_PLEWA|nr:hypothetical protein NDU88_001681 [Pleurodeles waltl]